MFKINFFVLILSFGLFFSGCASTESASKKSKDDSRPTAIDYYPLAIGNAWEYELSPIPKGKQSPVMRIEIISQDEQGFFIDNKGNKLKLHPQGIFDGQRFLLEDPLEIGHEWMSVLNAAAVEKYKIDKQGFQCSSPVGIFQNCVRVVAEQKSHAQNGQEITVQLLWTFAPKVGMLMLQQRIKTPAQGQKEVMRWTLKKMIVSKKPSVQ